MSAAEELPWVLRRSYDEDAPGDTEALMYLLSVSYTRTRAGARAGASKAGGSAKDVADDAIARDRERAFIDAHRPIWSWLLKHADVALLVDPSAPHIIWAWAITSGDDVVHAVGCKRNFTKREPGESPLSVELVAELLGERLKKHQVCTLELPQMRAQGSGTIGLDRPREWSLDPSWLLTRMGVGR